MITTTLEVSLLILSIEFALLAAGIAYFGYRNVRITEAKTTSEATELVSKVAQTEDSRRLALETVFRDKYNYDAEDLQSTVDEFMQREKAFYNAVIGAVLGRGDNKISNINDELTKVVAPWISLTPKNMVDAKSAEALSADKGRLETELSETKETLEKMISEYNRVFRLDDDVDDCEVDIDINSERAAASSKAQAPVPADEDDEIDYQTEELHDLDDILDSIAQKRKAADTTIVKLDEDPEPGDPAPTSSKIDPSAGVKRPTAGLDDLQELDALGGDEESPLEGRADKQMTADDLDELMESLDADESVDIA